MPRRAARRLRAAGIENVVTLAPDARQPLQRVRVGPIASVQQFDATIERLNVARISRTRGSHRIELSRYTCRLLCPRVRKRMKLSAPFAAICAARAAAAAHAPWPQLTSTMRRRPPLRARRRPRPPLSRSDPGGIPSAPQVDARAYILTDYTSGQVLAQQNADARMEPASLTKLMTCYVVFHALKAGTLKLTDRSRSASTPGVPRARAPSCRSAARCRPKCSSRA